MAAHLFQQIGLPRKVAEANNVPYAGEVNPDSPMWMGFLDQQTDGSSASAQTVTFVGDSHAKLTTAMPGDYFDNGSIQHLSQDIQDLGQFYAEAVQPHPLGGQHRPAHQRRRSRLHRQHLPGDR